MSSIKHFLALGALLFYCYVSTEAQVDSIVPEPSGQTRQQEPITLGVPFAQGALSSTSQLGIMAPNGNPVDAQFSVMSRWRDGSIRWLKCDFQANVAANAQFIYQLVTNSTLNSSTDLSVSETSTDIIIHTGPLRFTGSKNNYDLIDEAFLDLNANGNFFLKYETRIYAFAGQPIIKVRPTACP